MSSKHIFDLWALYFKNLFSPSPVKYTDHNIQRNTIDILLSNGDKLNFTVLGESESQLNFQLSGIIRKESFKDETT